MTNSHTKIINLSNEQKIFLWESVKEAVSTAIEAIKGFFTGLVDSIKQAWENIKTAISEKIDTYISKAISRNW